MRKAGIVAGAVALVLGALVAPGSATAEAEPVVRFHSVQYDSPGPDDRSPTSLNAEWIAVVNTGATPVNLLRWTVRDAHRSFTFGNYTLPGRGARVLLHTGKGRPTPTAVYWNSGAYIWNNTGDTAALRDAGGRTIDTCTWRQQKSRTWVAC